MKHRALAHGPLERSNQFPLWHNFKQVVSPCCLCRVELPLRYLHTSKKYKFKNIHLLEFRTLLNRTASVPIEQQKHTMHALRLFRVFSFTLVMVAETTRSTPLATLGGSMQDAPARHSSLRSLRDPCTPGIYHREPSLADVVLKRAVRPLGHAITLHALRTATYIGARTVLENLYSQIFAGASGQTPGATISYFEAEFGDVVISFQGNEHFG